MLPPDVASGVRGKPYRSPEGWDELCRHGGAIDQQIEILEPTEREGFIILQDDHGTAVGYTYQTHSHIEAPDGSPPASPPPSPPSTPPLSPVLEVSTPGDFDVTLT